MSSVDVSIEADGVEMWTDSRCQQRHEEIQGSNCNDFFAGNGEDYAGPKF